MLAIRDMAHTWSTTVEPKIQDWMKNHSEAVEQIKVRSALTSLYCIHEHSKLAWNGDAFIDHHICEMMLGSDCLFRVEII